MGLAPQVRSPVCHASCLKMDNNDDFAVHPPYAQSRTKMKSVTEDGQGNVRTVSFHTEPESIRIPTLSFPIVLKSAA